MSPLELTIHFFLQLALILLACRAVGLLAACFGQPQVVAEMITGVLLGPSLLGAWFPELSASLFPADSRKVLMPVSQLGLALYMFIVGMEFRVDQIRAHLRCAVSVSLAGMLAPFALGGLLGAWMHSAGGLFGEGTSVFGAVIFTGASMCITAFPMLARIIHFKGLSGTTMGTVAIGAGAIDDAAAWSLLAVVMASMSGDVVHAASNLGLAALYLFVCFALIRPALARWAKTIEASGDLSDSQYAFLLSLMCLGAWWTDRIELHAVFGAFIMGACMPRGLVSRRLVERTQSLSVALLLPLFFTYSGLNTKLGLLSNSGLWGWALAVLLAAIVGKGLACWGAARLSGLPNREALGIGILMNARGLMELIIINIGLQRGVIGPELFAMFAIMAVVTTLMASPLFELCVGMVRQGQHRSP